MAINIIISPGEIKSAYRPIIFKVQSTVTNKPELQIKGEIYARNILTDAYQLLAIKYEKKYLGNSYYIFDLSNILKSMVSFDRLSSLQSAGVILSTPRSVAQYKIKFTEVYYDGNGFPAEYATSWSTELFAVNTIPQHNEDQTLIDYILQSSTNEGSFGDSFNNIFN